MAYISVTNTFVNGNTADANDVNTNFSDLTDGLSDGTKDLNVLNVTSSSGVKSGGAETLKTWTYTHTITAPEAAAQTAEITISAVTLANIRALHAVINDATFVWGNAAQADSATYFLYVVNTTTTLMTVNFGSAYSSGDVISVTIIEAV